MTYPISFRRKVLSVREKENLSIAQVAQRFCVGVASVMRWIKTPDPGTTRNKPATRIDMEMLAQDVKDHPDAYQYERAKRLGVSTQGINHALKRLGVTYKKKACVIQRPAKQSGASSSRKLKAMSAQAASSFTLMKAALRMTCRVRMAMRLWVNAAMV